MSLDHHDHALVDLRARLGLVFLFKRRKRVYHRYGELGRTGSWWCFPGSAHRFIRQSLNCPASAGRDQDVIIITPALGEEGWGELYWSTVHLRTSTYRGTTIPTGIAPDCVDQPLEL